MSQAEFPQFNGNGAIKREEKAAVPNQNEQTFWRPKRDTQMQESLRLAFTNGVAILLAPADKPACPGGLPSPKPGRTFILVVSGRRSGVLAAIDETEQIQQEKAEEKAKQEKAKREKAGQRDEKQSEMKQNEVKPDLSHFALVGIYASKQGDAPFFLKESMTVGIVIDTTGDKKADAVKAKLKKSPHSVMTIDRDDSPAYHGVDWYDKQATTRKKQQGIAQMSVRRRMILDVLDSARDENGLLPDDLEGIYRDYAEHPQR